MHRSRRRSRSPRAWLKPRRLALVLLALVIAMGATLGYLDHVIRGKFEGKRWALPARVYAVPLELYPEAKLSADQLALELAALGYRPMGEEKLPGSFARHSNSVEVVTRPFVFWDGPQPSLHLQVRFADRRVTEVQDVATGNGLTLARLDPQLIGGIYPAHNEDRALVKLEQVPPLLVQTLIAVEDRKFHQHHGIDPRGIARALLANLRAADSVQGGSTLTQQLVKNFYLSAERTLRRKVTEVAMAILLDAHYEKDEILEAYINEIYLGQDGNRAIHGFGLASQFYFDREVSELTLPEIALLVGLVKGPSYYDPRRKPERALARRNLVLSELAKQGVIDQATYLRTRAMPLGVVKKRALGTSPYPAFLDLVHRQLRRDYAEQDLRSEGLQIFTTLDPRVQRAAERALAARLAALERQRKLPQNSLQGAVVVTSAEHGEVQAMVGGRDARFDGFNRALDAQRQIGSLMKPVVYLTALQRPDQYTLITLLDDSPLAWKEPGIDDWKPLNYDKQFHGPVELRRALAESYNVPAARVGLNLGVGTVVDTAYRMGLERKLPTYGSTLLGSGALTPFEVTQLYQTLASGGFRVPLRAIREVLTIDGQPLGRYSLNIEQAVDPGPMYLLTYAMQEVVRSGTADGLHAYMPAELNIAGKTGTTDDLRDSWFAGFTGDRLGVVWVGRDDSHPSALTGASGALTVWGAMMSQLDPEPLVPIEPETIEKAWVDPQTHLRAGPSCAGAVELPFIRGSAPRETAECGEAPQEGGGIKGWFRRWFGR